MVPPCGGTQYQLTTTTEQGITAEQMNARLAGPSASKCGDDGAVGW